MLKILIADDELYECQALSKMICDHLTEVQILPFAADGIELKERVRQSHPHIVIADINMPRMNGLNAIEEIRSEFPEMKVIVVTAYGEFEYAKRALKLGSMDYILKPVQPELFVAAVRKAVLSVSEEQERNQAKRENERIREDYSSLVAEGFLSNVLLGEVKQDNINRLLNLLKHPYYGGISLSVQLLDDRKKPGEEQKMIEKLSYKLAADDTGIQCAANGSYIICVFPNRPVLKKDEWTQKLMLRLNIILQSESSLCAVIGAGSLKKNIGELAESYQEALSARKHQKIKGIYLYEKDSSDPLRNILEQCLLLLRQKKVSEASSLIAGALALYSETQDSERRKARCVYFLFQLKRGIDAGKENDSILSWGLLYDEICVTTDLNYMEKQLDSILCRFISGTFEQISSHPGILQSISYIMRHFAEDISLQNVADHCYLNASYLSRLFRKETKKGFLDFIAEVRIGKAIILFSNPNKSVQETGTEVGYPNTNYFYRIFKKMTGVTVSEMREYIQLY